ncbi:threonine--tRNA ligase [Candidatus Pacearchaeota archaeon CG_4_9_14_0_2_um_filter_39_13]|nr:threonine--tRNA ligase [Candidatus Pacearchaeota archaeon]OIO42936.1 MAG: threonine--tRNA ligase [Candidatus Pacearchaeota archaeon CG1_02_39_14]PJC44998.1 MAG: threonine--tRNA ligase [Candidatus Pacearchaeota archaeon CG_4_9_14_0_2_um_filter_39_13]
MKIITLHCDYIRFKALKKAFKDAEELKDNKEHEIKDPLVILTAIEKGDNDQAVAQLVEAVKKTASEVKAKNIVLYPYAHLSSNLANPKTALEYLVEAENALSKFFSVTRAPFGHYKSFELKVKGHPLSELSKEFKGKAEDVKTEHKVIELEDYDISHLLRELSRSKLDTSKLKDNDHRILGQKLDLFSFNEASPGSIFWHPKGLVIFNELLKFSRKIQEGLDYQEVSTPQIYDNKLWKISGHWGLYRENMFLTDYEGRPAAVKPMNCPGHMLLYRAKSRSYKDFPIRFSEYSPLHRMELSGVLSGLFRVIRMHQDDAHIFVREDQLEDEIINVIRIIQKFLDTFNFKYYFTLSTRSKEKESKYLGDDKLWNSAEMAFTSALKKLKIKADKMPGEAKFYGPSLDVQIKDSLGREWQCSTLQLDFNFPERFELEYTGKDGKSHKPIVLHRAIFGSLERFIGVLLEHLSGNFPLWLSPRQVRVINFTDRNTKACEKLVETLKSELPELRIDSDLESDTVQSKIRNAELMKVNYVIVLGEKEEKSKTIAVRARGEKPKFGIKLDKFIKDLKKELAEPYKSL